MGWGVALPPAEKGPAALEWGEATDNPTEATVVTAADESIETDAGADDDETPDELEDDELEDDELEDDEVEDDELEGDEPAEDEPQAAATSASRVTATPANLGTVPPTW